MKNVPKVIYLQVDPEDERPDDFNELGEVTWCKDRIFDSDIAYYRVPTKINKRSTIMKKLFVVINEQHKLLEEQIKEINNVFGADLLNLELIYVKVPSSGWNISEMESIMDDWEKEEAIVLFVSPIPYMIREYAERTVTMFLMTKRQYEKRVWLFHNDKREKTETPDGRVIYKIAQDGWKIV